MSRTTEDRKRKSKFEKIEEMDKKYVLNVLQAC